MKSIAIFCGSSSGANKIYEEETIKLGRTLAQRSIQIVYGGGHVGLMGSLADAALENNGDVVGVMPKFLVEKEIAHRALTQLVTVESMHQRKKVIDEISDAIIVLPGGHGTMEEFFEMSTWAQLGLHQKPMGILNINGYYDDLIKLSKKMVLEGFTKDTYHNMLIISDSIEELLEKMEAYTPPNLVKWVTKENL